MSVALTLREESLASYIAEVKKYSLLSRDEELALAKRYSEEGDVVAAHQLVVANLRFVLKIAHEYKGYGLKLLDLIQEGNIGLMMAVKKFDWKKGYRLISYAVWWIRAYIQDFVLRSQSLVKGGTGRLQRKLFFKLRSARARLEQQNAAKNEAGASLTTELAHTLGASEADVSDMEVRLAGKDFSLDGEIGDGSGVTFLSKLESNEPSHEQNLIDAEQKTLLAVAVKQTLPQLNVKERYIVEQRLLAEEPKSLQEIGSDFNISRERVRQLEERVVGKLRSAFLKDEKRRPRFAS